MTREALSRVGAAAFVLGTLALAITVFFLTFYHVAEYWCRDEIQLKEGYRAWILVGAAALGSVPLWVRVLARLRDLGSRRLAVLGLAAGLVLAAAAVCRGQATEMLDLGDEGLTVSAWIGVVLGHAGFVAVAGGLIGTGVAAADRRYFWPGVLMVAALIFARFFEYETGLLLKAAVFMACGIGLIVGGIRFETYLRRRRAIHDNPQ